MTPASVRLPAHASLYARLPRGSRLLAPLLGWLPPVPVGIGDVPLRLAPGERCQLGLLRTRNFDAMKAAIVLASVKPGDLFVDVGANWGYFSLLAAARGADVLAVECDHSARREWTRAMRRHGHTGTVLPYAAHERDGETIAMSRPWFRHNVVTGHGNGRVTTATVDSLAQRRVAFLKVDAEGADLSVLKGARRVLTEDRPLVIAEPNGKWSEMREWMGWLGYRATVVEEKPGRVRCPEPGEDVAWDVLFEPS